MKTIEDHAKPAPTFPPPASREANQLSSLADALSTLSDRGLRRLLGARTFLRGLDYEKRRVVENVDVDDAVAQGKVKGSDPDPYSVTIKLGGEGITSHCTCPAFQKTGQHCKHVAALLRSSNSRSRDFSRLVRVPVLDYLVSGSEDFTVESADGGIRIRKHEAV